MSSDYTEAELAIYRKRLLEFIDDPMRVLEANCEAHRLDGIAAYLRRGRRLAHLDLDVLMWVIAQFPGSLSSDPAGFAYGRRMTMHAAKRVCAARNRHSRP